MKYIYIVTYLITHSYTTTVCPNDNNSLNLGYAYNGSFQSNKCTVKHVHKLQQSKDTSIAFKSGKKAWEYRDTMWYKNNARIDSIVIK